MAGRPGRALPPLTSRPALERAASGGFLLTGTAIQKGRREHPPLRRRRRRRRGEQERSDAGGGRKREKERRTRRSFAAKARPMVRAFWTANRKFNGRPHLVCG